MISTSEAASRRSGCPIYNRTLRKETGDGKLDYEVYLRTRELLALQTAAGELVVPDELLFQILHQTRELWLKCAAFETATFSELYRVLERFVDWDTAFVEHFMLARRTLGIDKAVPALDGFPTVALGARMTRPLFPALWNVRVLMSRA